MWNTITKWYNRWAVQMEKELAHGFNRGKCRQEIVCKPFQRVSYLSETRF